MKMFSRTAILALSYLAAIAVYSPRSASGQKLCYNLSRNEALQIIPCNDTAAISACCNLDHGDTCLSNGLCIASEDGGLWIDGCTDPAFADPACAAAAACKNGMILRAAVDISPADTTPLLLSLHAQSARPKDNMVLQ